jgi:hypothetical protein
MRTQLEGYKGTIRNFVAPVSESKFNADKFNFTDASGSNLPFRMNNILGEPSRKHDVLSLGAMKDFSRERIKVFSYSDISTSTSAYQEFDLSTLYSISRYKIRPMSGKLFVNSVLQFNKPSWTGTTGVDYYYADNYKKLRLRKQTLDSGVSRGITLASGDEILLKYKIQPKNVG